MHWNCKKVRFKKHFRKNYLIFTNQIIPILAITKTNITTLSGRYSSISNQFYSDVGYLQGLINTIATNLSVVNTEVEANEEQMLIAAANIATATEDLAAAEGKILKLQSVNSIWQKNFRVVNQTFSELRRKVQFLVPGRFLQVIPLAYGVVVQRPNKRPLIPLKPRVVKPKVVFKPKPKKTKPKGTKKG